MTIRKIKIIKSNDSRHLCNNFCNKVSTCRNFNFTAGFVYSFTIPNLTFMFPYILRNWIWEKRIYLYWLCITQFVIFNHWKVSRNRTALYWNFFMSPALMRRNWRSCKGDLFFQILLFLWNNSLAVSKLQTEQGDSSENYAICPLRNALESCYSFQSKWDTRSANKFAKVYVKLELSGNEKFITSGATVKILPSLKGPFTKGFQTIQKIKSAFGSVYLSGWFWNLFLL